MQYRLRTALILLTIVPPLLAAAWIAWPVAEAALAALTTRDWLWMALVAGLGVCWWLRDRHRTVRMRALAERIQRLRG